MPLHIKITFLSEIMVEVNIFFYKKRYLAKISALLRSKMPRASGWAALLQGQVEVRNTYEYFCSFSLNVFELFFNELAFNMAIQVLFIHLQKLK